MILNTLKIVFFGTSDFATIVLDELKQSGIEPTLIVTTPDKPKGRKLVITPPPVKIWAEKNNIDTIQPEKLRDADFLGELENTEWDLFIVVSYGKIIPKEILALPKHGTLNVHASLLPKFRGPSPIQSTILADERETGVTVMLVDEEVDHGPVVAQASVAPEDWPLKASLLKEILAHVGGSLLAEIIPQWVKGEITPEEQKHNAATHTKIIKKEDGLIKLDDDPYKNFLKIQAFDEWPGSYFFKEVSAEKSRTNADSRRKKTKKIRIKITDASFENNTVIIKKIIPEGKKEMSYKDFMRSEN